MLTEFTPLHSLSGGLLIGLAVVLLMGTFGRAMGVSGILAGVIRPADRGDRLWRIALVAGMVAGPSVLWALTGQMPAVQVEAGRGALIAGGLLVGLGVTLGSGCTSGHGICGLARLSPRSLAAMLTFMAATAITVWVIRHGLGG